MAHFLQLNVVHCVSKCLVMLYSETQHTVTPLNYHCLSILELFCKCSKQRYKMCHLGNIFPKTA